MADRERPQFHSKLDLQKIGRVLQMARGNLRMSYRELANESGLSATQILRMEIGNFEYSALKLHQLCEALGLPVADVLEYGIECDVTTSLPGFIDEADIVQLGRIAQTRGDDPAVCTERARRFVGYIFAMTARALLLSFSSAIHFQAADQTPEHRHHFAMDSFVGSLQGMDNATRRNHLRGLYRAPYQKLRSFGLVNLRILDRVTAKDEEWHVAPFVPETVQATEDSWKTQIAVRQGLLDKGESVRQLADMPTKVSAVEHFMARLERATRRRGTRSALARELGVSRQAVDNWIHGKAKPKAELYARMIQWVDAFESPQNKSPGSALTPPEQQTQKRNHDEEEPDPGPPPKYRRTSSPTRAKKAG